MTQIPCLFFLLTFFSSYFFFFFLSSLYCFSYKKLRAVLAMEGTKPINQNKVTKETISTFLHDN